MLRAFVAGSASLRVLAVAVAVASLALLPSVASADTDYGPLKRAGVRASSASISGLMVSVRVTLTRRTAVRVVVLSAKGRPLATLTKATLKRGRYVFRGRLRTVPSGSLRLRITVRDLKTGEVGRRRSRVRVVRRAPSAIGLRTATVAENLPAGTAVGTLTAIDRSALDRHRFALVPGPGGADNDAFSVDGTTLRTTRSFDFESKATYQLLVRATDVAGLTRVQALVVTVGDVNEPPTDLTLTGSAVAENQPAGTAVGTLTGTDPDASDTRSFALVPGVGSDDNASFAISGAVLSTATTFDFEAKPTRSIRVRVTDNAGATFERQFTIAVTDVNDAPVLTPSAGDLAYPLGSGPVAVDPNLTVQDVDSTITGATVRISSNFVAAEDTLAAPAASGITGSYDSGTGTLTLTGTGSPADYQAVLRGVTYSNSSSAASQARRVITFRVTDSGGATAEGARGIAVS